MAKRGLLIGIFILSSTLLADNIVNNSPVMRREAEMIPAFGKKDFHKHCRKNVIDLMCLANSSFLFRVHHSYKYEKEITNWPKNNKKIIPERIW